MFDSVWHCYSCRFWTAQIRFIFHVTVTCDMSSQRWFYLALLVTTTSFPYFYLILSRAISLSIFAYVKVLPIPSYLSILVGMYPLSSYHSLTIYLILSYLPILTQKVGEARIVCWMPSFIYLWACAQTMWPYHMTICTIPSPFLVPLKPFLASPSGGNPRND